MAARRSTNHPRRPLDDDGWVPSPIHLAPDDDHRDVDDRDEPSWSAYADAETLARTLLQRVPGVTER